MTTKRKPAGPSRKKPVRPKNKSLTYLVTVKGFSVGSGRLFFAKALSVKKGRGRPAQPAVAELHYNRDKQSLEIQYTDGSCMTFGV